MFGMSAIVIGKLLKAAGRKAAGEPMFPLIGGVRALQLRKRSNVLKRVSKVLGSSEGFLEKRSKDLLTKEKRVFPPESKVKSTPKPVDLAIPVETETPVNTNVEPKGRKKK